MQKFASFLAPPPPGPVGRGRKWSNLPLSSTLKWEWTPPHAPLGVRPGDDSHGSRYKRRCEVPFPLSRLSICGAAPQGSLFSGLGEVPDAFNKGEERERPKGSPEGQRALSSGLAPRWHLRARLLSASIALFICLPPAPTFMAKQVHSLHAVKRRYCS